jgi:hypothetical protein
VDARDQFLALLRAQSGELFARHSDVMASGDLLPIPNVIDEGDARLFFEAVEAGIVEVGSDGRFNTLDRPTPGGHWALLSRSQRGGWFNAEYLPQVAAYADAILHRGYPANRVLFELPASALQLDLAILDDDGRVVVLGEAKRAASMLDRLVTAVMDRFGAAPPGEETKKRGDEARQLAWRLWTVRPALLWLIAPGVREAYSCSFEPLELSPAGGLPRAAEMSLGHDPRVQLAPPSLLPKEAPAVPRTTPDAH